VTLSAEGSQRDQARAVDVATDQHSDRVGIIYCSSRRRDYAVPLSVCWATINSRDEIAHGFLRIAERPEIESDGLPTLSNGFFTPHAAVRTLNQDLAGARLESDFANLNSGLRALYRCTNMGPSWIDEGRLLSQIWEDLSIHIGGDLRFRTFGPMDMNTGPEESALSFVQHYRKARRARDIMIAALRTSWIAGPQIDARAVSQAR